MSTNDKELAQECLEENVHVHCAKLDGWLLSRVHHNITGHPCYLPDAELRLQKYFFADILLAISHLTPWSNIHAKAE